MLPWKSRCTCHFEWWFSLDRSPGMGLQDHMIPLCLMFQGTSMLFSIMASPVTVPPRPWEDSIFCTSCTAFILCRYFRWWPLWLCKVIAYWSFDWHWFNNYWCGVSSHVLLLFYTLRIQFTSWNWLLETWPCLEFFCNDFSQDISWR